MGMLQFWGKTFEPFLMGDRRGDHLSLRLLPCKDKTSSIHSLTLGGRCQRDCSSAKARGLFSTSGVFLSIGAPAKAKACGAVTWETPGLNSVKKGKRLWNVHCKPTTCVTLKSESPGSCLLLSILSSHDSGMFLSFWSCSMMLWKTRTSPREFENPVHKETQSWSLAAKLLLPFKFADNSSLSCSIGAEETIPCNSVSVDLLHSSSFPRLRLPSTMTKREMFPKIWSKLWLSTSFALNCWLIPIKNRGPSQIPANAETFVHFSDIFTSFLFKLLIFQYFFLLRELS